MPRQKVKYITINTDASFNPEHHTAGYAFTIVCDQFRIKKSGMFKTRPETSQQAEIMCIGNALSTLAAQPELPTCDCLIVNTDCKGAMSEITHQATQLGKRVHGMYEKLSKKLDNKHFQFKHVKAHTNVKDPRSIVNRWCDTEAKKWMRLATTKHLINPHLYIEQ